MTEVDDYVELISACLFCCLRVLCARCSCLLVISACLASSFVCFSPLFSALCPTHPPTNPPPLPPTQGIGDPDLIEIKGVTFCGKSPISTLRMEHVPWHVEVRRFAQAIADRTNGKGIEGLYVL